MYALRNKTTKQYLRSQSRPRQIRVYKTLQQTDHLIRFNPDYEVVRVKIVELLADPRSIEEVVAFLRAQAGIRAPENDEKSLLQCTADFLEDEYCHLLADGV